MNIEMTDLDMILNHLETTSLEPHDDYTSEITYKDQKILYKYIKNLQQENQQLKKQLYELGGVDEFNKHLLTQQDEFIKHLEDEIKRKRLNATCMFEYNDTVLPLEEILQKYKEMIGDDK